MVCMYVDVCGVRMFGVGIVGRCRRIGDIDGKTKTDRIDNQNRTNKSRRDGVGIESD
jgi:hypothetical protein